MSSSEAWFGKQTASVGAGWAVWHVALITLIMMSEEMVAKVTSSYFKYIPDIALR